MGDFRTFRSARRAPAEALRPVVDPAGWTPRDLADVDRWSYRMTPAECEELAAGIAAFRRRGTPLAAITREDFPLGALAGVLADVRRELIDGRGIVMMRGFPVDRFTREETAIAYLGMGSYIGRAITQNREGHVLGHVKDLGGDYNDPNTRAYLTRAELRFHADGCDYVGLLCLKTSMRGGESRVASSVTLYNRLLDERPDLAKVLCEDFHVSRVGDISPGQAPSYLQPVFSFIDGYFSATGAGMAIEKAQRLPGVPAWTEAQREAVALYRKHVDECAADIDFRPGDIQLLNNFVTLHTRRAYEDWPDAARKRHLLRLWLMDPEGRPIPREQREGRAGSGVQIAGVERIAPLEADVTVS